MAQEISASFHHRPDKTLHFVRVVAQLSFGYGYPANAYTVVSANHNRLCLSMIGSFRPNPERLECGRKPWTFVAFQDRARSEKRPWVDYADCGEIQTHRGKPGVAHG